MWYLPPFVLTKAWMVVALMWGQGREMGPSVNSSSCLVLPSLLDLADAAIFRSTPWETEHKEGKVPGLAPSKLCRGPLSSGEVARSHQRTLVPYTGNGPQAGKLASSRRGR